MKANLRLFGTLLAVLAVQVGRVTPAVAADAGDSGVLADAGVVADAMPLACDGALCATSNDSTCSIGTGRVGARTSGMPLPAAALVVVALACAGRRCRRSRRAPELSR